MFILVFIITILILVVIHEFGHFFAAKKFNIKVLEFGFGLPPRAWGKKIGETIWSLNWLPFGGFVRLLGEDETDQKALDNHRSFAFQPVGKRMLVVVAGVLMNLFLAWLLFWIVLSVQNFQVQVPLLTDHKFVAVNQKNVDAILISQTKDELGVKQGERITQINGQDVESYPQLLEEVKKDKDLKINLTISDIEKTSSRNIEVFSRNQPVVLIETVSDESPAKNAGLKPGEKISAINNQNIINLEQFIKTIRENAGQTVLLNIEDEKSTIRQVSLTPRKNPPPQQGALGISLAEEIFPDLKLTTFKVANLNYQTIFQKILSGPIHSYNLAAYSGEILTQTIKVAFQRKDITPVSSTVAGPVGITNLVKEILQVQNPLVPYLNFMAMLSLNLAVVNILPFPGLDGGRFFFLLVEAVTRKKAHPVLEKYIHAAGLFILLSLIILVTISDIRKLFL